MPEATTRFTLTHHTSPDAGRIAIVTMDNGRDWRTPTLFDDNALVSLAAVLDDLEADDDLAGMLLTGKPFVFAAGADLNRFAGADATFARQAARAGHRVFRRVADLPVPTLAAINGACMGGGLEMALHCDYRTISTSARPVAFPEVFLSILPGWGGTQLAPRIVGVEAALRTIVHDPLDNNRTMRADQVARRGFADRLVGSATFLDDSRALLERIVTGEETIERDVAHGDLDQALADAREAADDRVHGATRAPYLAIDLIEFAARGGDLDEGLRREEDALAELLPARQAQASVYSFQLTQRRVKKQPWRPVASARDVRQVAVVGAGLMGSQLGALILQRLQVPLVMKDIDADVLDRSRGRIERALDDRVGRGRMQEGRARFLKEHVTYTLDYDDVAGSDLVIEAVLEDLDLKRRVFADLEKVLGDEAVLATNTSSLSVGAMAEGLDHPERVVGMHFFNPVAVLPLVEVVRAEKTSDATVSTALEVATGLRKSPVPCADRPAFVVNRILARFMGACARAVTDGADFADVDDAVKQLGLPMGPFELMGFVGLKVAVHTVETLAGAFPDRFTADDNLRLLGEVEVEGIYDWSKGRVAHAAISDGWNVDESASTPDGDEIRRRAVDAVADEIGHMLDEGVVADARDIDTCLLLGAGWPFFMGGVCMYLDQTGVSERVVGRRLVGAQDAAVADGGA